MSVYLDHIIKYFFRHKVSDEIASRVQDRLVHSEADAEASLREIWDSLEGTPMDETAAEEAYSRVTSTLFGQEAPVRRRSWLRIAAMWAVPILLLGGAVWYYTSATRQAKLYADLSKAERDLHWHAGLTVDDAIKDTLTFLNHK